MSGRRAKLLKKSFEDFFKRGPVGAIWGMNGAVITPSEWRTYKKRYQWQVKQLNAEQTS